MDRYLLLDECPSTNTYLSDLVKSGENLPQLFTIATKYQSNGRGQRGNTWASEKGKNLTISILLRTTTIKAMEQFYISEITAIAVSRTIVMYLNEEQRENIKIKWPNDIYYNDKKIAGILIENSLLANSVEYSIIGIGLNVNQSTFPRNLPQAISINKITNRTYNLQDVLNDLHRHLENMCELINSYKFQDIHKQYIRLLYRKDSIHSYTDINGNIFNATIKDVLPTGKIILRMENGEEHYYNFKEIIFNA